MPVFFIEPEAIQGDGITLTGSLAHHLVESLRIQPGEELWLGHSGGLRFRARVIRADAGRLTADIISSSNPPLFYKTVGSVKRDADKRGC